MRQFKLLMLVVCALLMKNIVPSVARGKCLDADGIAIFAMDDNHGFVMSLLLCHPVFAYANRQVIILMRIYHGNLTCAHRHFDRWLPLCSLLT